MEIGKKGVDKELSNVFLVVLLFFFRSVMIVIDDMTEWDSVCR